MFDGNCSSMFFQMKCDVYYAQESQNNYGKIEKHWEFGQSIDCSLYTPDDETNYKNFDFDDKKFFRLEGVIVGRSKTDPRKSSDGKYYPLSHMLITNIRSAGCENELFFIETDEDFVVSPTVFDVSSCQPYIGAFANIEYYKLALERSDTQELNFIAIR